MLREMRGMDRSRGQFPAKTEQISIEFALKVFGKPIVVELKF